MSITKVDFGIRNLVQLEQNVQQVAQQPLYKCSQVVGLNKEQQVQRLIHVRQDIIALTALLASSVKPAHSDSTLALIPQLDVQHA